MGAGVGKSLWKHSFPWHFFCLLGVEGGVRSGHRKWQMLVGSVDGVAVGKEGKSVYGFLLVSLHACSTDVLTLEPAPGHV